MVVFYHLYPSLLTGGFAGVDVFFVISGYLITGHMLREYRKTGRIGLLEFWGRRAKRLVPAAALVLTVTWAASRLVLPATRLADTAAQIRASALYYENWQLAWNAVDYLKSDSAASPVQHFWSLSVEEQFYLGWPFLFVFAALVALTVRRRSRHSQEDVEQARRPRAPRAHPAGERGDRRLALLFGLLHAGQPVGRLLRDDHPDLGARDRRPDRAAPRASSAGGSAGSACSAGPGSAW